MELQIKPYHSNAYPLRGILIKGTNPNVWSSEIQGLGLQLEELEVYPVPNTQANSVWGCLLIIKEHQKITSLGKHEACQLVHQLLLIPEKSTIFPALEVGELKQLFGGIRHLMHPDFGLVELSEPVDWPKLIEIPEAINLSITKPSLPDHSPSMIRRFLIHSVPPEEALKALEEGFPQKGTLDDKPLNGLEKGKLFLYEKLFGKGKPGTEGGMSGGAGGLGGFAGMLGSIIPNIGGGFMQKMMSDFEDLARRNQKEADKLLDLLKRNPEEALKYAIPLDEKGAGRGNNQMGNFTMSKRWSDFSLFGGRNGGGSGYVDLGDSYFELRKQYLEAANKLIKEGQYKKAAFIYLKLLSDYTKAAETLEMGGFYQEAASIYLKYLKDKKAAARCYEKGHYIMEAIDIYEDLEMYEKVGDLYRKIDKLEEANIYYAKVVAKYKEKHQFIQASLICKNKMEDMEQAQGLLMEGWRSNRDAFNCLNNYFNNIPDERLLWEAISTIYQEEVTDRNSDIFLQVIKYEYKKSNDLAVPIRDIAYEIVAKRVPRWPGVVSELIAFNKTDDKLVRDTIWFRQGR